MRSVLHPHLGAPGDHLFDRSFDHEMDNPENEAPEIDSI